MRKTICSLVAAAFLAGPVALSGCKYGPNDDEYIFIYTGVPNQASRERLAKYYQEVEEQEYDPFVAEIIKYSGNGVDFRCLGPIEAKQILANLDAYRKTLPEGVTITSDYNPDEGTLEIRPSGDYHINQLKLVDGLKVDIKYCYDHSPGCNMLSTKTDSS